MKVKTVGVHGLVLWKGQSCYREMEGDVVMWAWRWRRGGVRVELERGVKKVKCVIALKDGWSDVRLF